MSKSGVIHLSESIWTILGHLDSVKWTFLSRSTVIHLSKSIWTKFGHLDSVKWKGTVIHLSMKMELVFVSAMTRFCDWFSWIEVIPLKAAKLNTNRPPFWMLKTLNAKETSNDIIAGNGRERFMIEFKFLKNDFYGTALFLTNCIFRLHN